ncbi:MAG: hypothetical protein ACOYYS_22635 [Chloroflexota bacterium]
MTSLRSRFFQADFDEKTGKWSGLTAIRWNAAPILGKGAGFDLEVNGQSFWGKRPRKVNSFRYFAEGRGGAFILEQDGLSLTHSIELDAALPVIYQSVLIKANQGPDRQINALSYTLPAFIVGEAADCLIHEPGTDFQAGIPYAKATVRPRQPAAAAPPLDPAPSFGLLAIENRVQKRVASCWLQVELAPTFPIINGQDGVVNVSLRHSLNATLQAGGTVISQGFCLLLTDGTLDEHLAQFRRVAY